MTFRLSQRSFQKLVGVNEQLQDTVKKAIELTKIDFGVIYGVRTFDEQKKLYDAGRSQTMNSKHLLQDDETGHAVEAEGLMGNYLGKFETVDYIEHKDEELQDFEFQSYFF